MDTAIALLRGPLFRISLAICLLGLAYRFGTMTWQIIASYRKAGDKNIPRHTVLRATFQWVFPARVLRLRPVYGIASFVFHLGILLVPIFYVGHVTLWQSSLRIAWPVLGPEISDLLTIVALIGLGGILAFRLAVKASRDLTAGEDIWILSVLLILTASGYLAAHPADSPFGPRSMLLVHLLTGNLALILTPLTKIVHCILFPLTQILSEVGWHFPAASGWHVAIALAKKDEPI